MTLIGWNASSRKGRIQTSVLFHSHACARSAREERGGTAAPLTITHPKVAALPQHPHPPKGAGWGCCSGLGRDLQHRSALQHLAFEGVLQAEFSSLFVTRHYDESSQLPVLVGPVHFHQHFALDPFSDEFL